MVQRPSLLLPDSFAGSRARSELVLGVVEFALQAHRLSRVLVMELAQSLDPRRDTPDLRTTPTRGARRFPVTTNLSKMINASDCAIAEVN